MAYGSTPGAKKLLKKTDELISNEPNAIIYAMDEAGIKRDATITSCWCIKGKTSVVLSPATHDKINLVGVSQRLAAAK